MKKIISRNKSIVLLLFLFGYNNLFGYASGEAACRSHEAMIRRVNTLNELDRCSMLALSDFSNPHAYLYFKMPKLDEKYFDYPAGNSLPRRDKSIPILMEFDSRYLNPRKEDFRYYQVSSKYKEELIKTNPTIAQRSCLHFASGSEYKFLVPARTGNIRIIVYYDIVNDLEVYDRIRFSNQVKYYENRSLFIQQFTFEEGKTYELEMNINSKVSLPDLNTIAVSSQGKLPTNVNGFTITLKELPPNTKFAFDGKDDVGKTYEQVKKEFILYDKSAEEK